ncbi:MAG: hypothetical protein ACTHME_02320 [Candidatus Nitrosocosmicus sp.]
MANWKTFVLQNYRIFNKILQNSSLEINHTYLVLEMDQPQRYAVVISVISKINIFYRRGVISVKCQRNSFSTKSNNI